MNAPLAVMPHEFLNALPKQVYVEPRRRPESADGRSSSWILAVATSAFLIDLCVCGGGSWASKAFLVGRVVPARGNLRGDTGSAALPQLILAAKVHTRATVQVDGASVAGGTLEARQWLTCSSLLPVIFVAVSALRPWQRHKVKAAVARHAINDVLVQAGPTGCLLAAPLPCIKGVLSNGMRYVVMQHAVPPQRFEAHLEFHVGSVDEEETQRGMAHMMEHICFLGSDRRIELNQRGVRMTSNALTDFHHTVFHLSLGTGHVTEGLNVLAEVGFAPAFRPERIEKERAAVLSEAQMVNDLTYRLQSQIIAATHSENRIHQRFPIGLEDQIGRWTQAELRAFHRKWYAPENATLWVVGDFAEDDVVADLHRVFGGVPRSQEAPLPTRPWDLDASSLSRPPMLSRPMVLHDYVVSQSTEAGEVPALRAWSSDLKVSVASSELVQGLQLCWAAKSPLRGVSSQADLLRWLCTRLVVEAIRLRLQTRWCSGAVPCNFHVYDSYREGVALTTFTVLAEPMRWQETCQEALQEVLAVARYGVDEDELDLIMKLTLGKVDETARAQPGALMGTLSGYDAATTSRDVVEAMINSSPYGHVLTNARAFSTALHLASAQIDLKMFNAATKEVLGHFGSLGIACGTVVVSAPAAMTEEFTGRKIPFPAPSTDDVERTLRKVVELSEAEVRAKKIAVPQALLQSSAAVAPLERRELPGGVLSLRLANGLRVRLLVHEASPEVVQSGMRLRAPGGRAQDASAGSHGAIDVGLRVLETAGAGEWSREQVQLYKKVHSVTSEFTAAPDVSELNLSFTPSNRSCRAALEWLHWLLRSPEMSLQSFTEAQLRMKGKAHACEKSLEAKAMQVLKQTMYPNDPWLWDTTLEQLNSLTLGQAKRATQAQLGSLSFLELDIATSVSPSISTSSFGAGLSHEEEGDGEAAVQQQHGLVTGAAGPDAAFAEFRQMLEREVCSTLGALSGSSSRLVDVCPMPRMARQGCELRVHVPDADERAMVILAGGAPGYWGQGDPMWQEAMDARITFSDAPSRSSLWAQKCKANPLYASAAMGLMVECMNTRLLGRIRDQLSLTYSCDLEITMYDGFPAGFFVCKLFAAPSRLANAAVAALEVLRSPERYPFMDREVEVSKSVFADRERRDRREERYWLDKLRPLPSGECGAARVAEEHRVLEAISTDDVQSAWGALVGLEDPFVVLTTSGHPGVASMLPHEPVVDRYPRPSSTPATTAITSAGLDLLD